MAPIVMEGCTLDAKGRSRRRRAGRLLGALVWTGAGLAGFGLSGCHQPGDHDTAVYHPTAEVRTFRADVAVPTLSPDGTRAVVSLPEGFLDDYRRRARTPMSVTVLRDAGPEEREAARMLQGWLEDEGGIDTVYREVAGVVPAGAGRTIGLSFQAYVAVVPNCGDWSGTAGFNPTNAHHTNFGCAYHRNFGLMLSDPGDLVRGRSAGSADATRQTVVLQKYRAGEATGAKAPRGEARSLTGIGE